MFLSRRPTYRLPSFCFYYKGKLAEAQEGTRKFRAIVSKPIKSAKSDLWGFPHTARWRPFGNTHATTGKRQAACYLALAEASTIDRPGGPEDMSWLVGLATDHDNLRARLSWYEQQRPSRTYWSLVNDVEPQPRS